jgi:hypothetical protein
VYISQYTSTDIVILSGGRKKLEGMVADGSSVYGPVCDVHAVGNGVRAGHIIRGSPCSVATSLVLLQQEMI